MNKFTDLKPRIVSAAIGGTMMLSCIVLGRWGFFVVFLSLSCLTLWEFYRLLRIQSYLPVRVFGIPVCGFLFVLTFLIEGEYLPHKLYVLIFPLASFIFLIKLYKKKDDSPFINIGLFYLGLLYVALPISLTNMLVFYDGVYTSHILIGLLLLTWSNDIGAYFVGIAFGRTKLFHRISPKKSWEGSIGGSILCILVAVVLSNYFNVLTPWQWICVSLIILSTGTYGDLVESFFKRSMNIKDSGSVLPGHGGFLDRFDSLLLAIPFVVVFLTICK